MSSVRSANGMSRCQVIHRCVKQRPYDKEIGNLLFAVV